MAKTKTEYVADDFAAFEASIRDARIGGCITPTKEWARMSTDELEAEDVRLGALYATARERFERARSDSKPFVVALYMHLWQLRVAWEAVATEWTKRKSKAEEG